MITNTKKYLFIGILGLLITGILGVLIYKYSPLYSKSLFDYIPKDFDKVFYIGADQDLQELIRQLPEDKMKADFKEQLLNINKVGVFQFLTGSNAYSLIVVDVKPSFDIQKAIKAGLVDTGDNSTFENVGATTFLYGKKEAIDFIKNYNGPSISENENVKSYVSDVKDGKYNTFMASKIELTPDMMNGYFADFLKYFNYSVLVSHIGKEDNFGQIDILFQKDMNLAKQYKFDSTLSKYSNSTDLAFVEIGNLVKFVGLTKEALNNMVQSYFATASGNFGSMFLPSDYEKLVNSFDGNIAINVSQSSNLLGVGANVIFEKGGIYDVAYKFYPYLKEISSKNTFSGSIELFEETNKFGVNVVLPYQAGKIDGKIYLEKKGDNAVLSILDGKLGNGNDNIKLESINESVISFYLNSSSFIDLFQKFALFSGQVKQIGTDFDFIKDKKFYGSINYYPNKLNFKIKAIK